MKIELEYFVLKSTNNKWTLHNDKILFNNIHFILEGNAHFKCGDFECDLKKGEAVFIPYGSERIARTNGMECAAFTYQSDQELFNNKPTKFTWNNDIELMKYFLELNRNWIIKSQQSEIYCNGIILMIFSRIIEIINFRQKSIIVRRMERYLIEHYTEKISVNDISQKFGLNTVYCGALFKKESGKTIIEFINNLRINLAENEIKFGNENISQIAFKCGYDDIYYFSRIFKKITGISPKQFRNISS